MKTTLTINRGDLDNITVDITGTYVPRQRSPFDFLTTPAHFVNIEARRGTQLVELTRSEQEDAEAALFCELSFQVGFAH